MRRILVLTVVAAVMLAVAPASAGPPADLHIEVATNFVDEEPDVFVASGPAVEAGLVCPMGEVEDVFVKASGFNPPDTGFNVQVVKRFICDGGSGDFRVKLQVRIDGKGTNFNWVVLGGTGAYSSLRGAGGGFGIQGEPCGDEFACVTDIYDGEAHAGP